MNVLSNLHQQLVHGEFLRWLAETAPFCTYGVKFDLRKTWQNITEYHETQR